MNSIEKIKPARLPSYLLKKIQLGGETFRLKQLIRRASLNTVCEQALCPNITECFRRGEVTFLIMGKVCSRDCGFCGVIPGRPRPPDPAEPEKVADAAGRLNLKYVVLTSVTRDDLPDGGAAHFAACVSALRRKLPGVGVELLIPDFQGSASALSTVLESGPDVLAHNLETVKSLYHRVRPRSGYRRSLNLLSEVKKYSPGILTKSGFMVGLGESDEEIRELMEDIRQSGVSILTIGHYLPPTGRPLPLKNPRRPEKFEEYSRWAEELGFAAVAAGIFVRSSYRAGELLKNAQGKYTTIHHEGTKSTKF